MSSRAGDPLPLFRRVLTGSAGAAGIFLHPLLQRTAQVRERAARITTPAEAVRFSHMFRWASAAVVFVAGAMDGQSLSSKGWRRPSRADLVLAAAAAASVHLASRAAARVLEVSDDVAQVQMLAALPAADRMFTVGTAAVTEEIEHRMFLWNAIHDATGRPLVATGGDSAVFLLRHREMFDVQQLVSGLPTFLGCSLFFAWRRNLPATMLMHGLVDSVLLAPRLFGLLPRDRY